MIKRLFFFCMLISIASFVFGQNRTITGTVTSSEDKQPLPGVTVMIQNTTTGTQTDLDGTFKIEVTSPNAVLVFSFIGMKQQKMTVGSATNYTIVLAPDLVGIEEVVVTVPYGTQKKETFTGSLGLMQADDMKKQREESVDKMLQGVVAGVVSSNSSGQPGSKSEIMIRGTGSMAASTEPLYVIDGIPVSSGPSDINILTTINPEDIESITVLKDASATSLYGSRASNGVIMITTKKGINGKTSFSFSSQQGITAAVNSNLKVLNTSQYLSIQKQELANAGYSADYIKKNIGTDTINTNWQKQVYRYGYVQNYDFSATGGDEKTNFFISGSYNNEKGIVINTGLRKLTARMNLNHKVNEKLSFGTKITIANTFQQAPHDQLSTANEIYGSYTLAPNAAVKKNDSTYTFNNLGKPFYNVVGINALDNITNTTNRLFANGFIEYKLNKKITLKTVNGLDYIDFTQNQYVSPLTPDGAGKNGVILKGLSTLKTFTTSNTLDYNTKFKDVHSLDLVAGYEVQYSKNDSTMVGTNTLPTSSIQVLSSGANVEKLSAPITDWAIISYLSNLQYNYKGKYYFSGSYRRDGSSRFLNNRWSNFWSSGFSWRISDEAFMKQFTKLNSLRLHTSYGTSGNSELLGSPYASRYLFEYGHNYNNLPGGYPIQIGNDNLTWEKNNNADLGLEFRVYKRIAGSVDIYHRTTSNLLLNVPISVTNGFETQLQNIGAMVNKGVEFSLTTQNVKAEKFDWSTDFNIALNHNEITALSQGNDIISTVNIKRVGLSNSSFYLADWAGVSTADGSPLWYDTKGNVTKEYANARKVVAGNADPKFILGLGNTITYDRLKLSFSLYGKYGNKIYDNIEQIMESDGALTNINQSTKLLNAWQKPGDVTDVPKLIYNNPTNSNQPSTRYLVDGSYLKLRNITISYQLSDNLAHKAKLHGISVYVQGQNLWTWTRYAGIDPEQVTRGVSWFRYPNSRTVIGGITITM